MILEALEYLTTPCPPWARSMGYLGEAIAIRHRARRCKKAWEAHQKNTRQAILSHGPDQAGHMIILGAGLCLDVPVRDLCARTGKLTLMDAVRLRGVSLPAGCDYVCRDVHGASERFYREGTFAGRASPFSDFPQEAAVISVNLLSQLPILPFRAGLRRGLVQQAQKDEFAARMMQDHVSDLKHHCGPSLLIAEAQKTYRDPKVGVLEQMDIAAMAGLPEPLEVWAWSIVPAGEDPGFGTLDARVGVWRL